MDEGRRLHDYEAFLAIVDAGNLTRAATRLGRSLQSVSRSLGSLERQLGVVLIRRTTRRAQPTEAGLALHRRIAAALREIGLAEAEVRDAAVTLRGALRISASTLFATKYLVPAIHEFRALHPDVHFDLRIAERFTEPMKTGADLVFRVGELAPSPLKAKKLAMFRRVVVASPAYLAEHGRPEHPRDLLRHACLVRAGSQDARTWSFRGPDGAPVAVTLRSSFESNNVQVIHRAAQMGLGVAMTHFWVIRDAIEAGELEVLLEEHTLAPVPLHALWPAAPQALARVKRFVELLTRRLKKEHF